MSFRLRKKRCTCLDRIRRRRQRNLQHQGEPDILGVASMELEVDGRTQASDRKEGGEAPSTGNRGRGASWRQERAWDAAFCPKFYTVLLCLPDGGTGEGVIGYHYGNVTAVETASAVSLLDGAVADWNGVVFALDGIAFSVFESNDVNAVVAAPRCLLDVGEMAAPQFSADLSFISFPDHVRIGFLNKSGKESKKEK